MTRVGECYPSSVIDDSSGHQIVDLLFRSTIYELTSVKHLIYIFCCFTLTKSSPLVSHESIQLNTFITFKTEERYGNTVSRMYQCGKSTECHTCKFKIQDGERVSLIRFKCWSLNFRFIHPQNARYSSIIIIYANVM